MTTEKIAVLSTDTSLLPPKLGEGHSFNATNTLIQTNIGATSDPTWDNKYQKDLSRAYNLNSFCLHIGQSLRFMGIDDYSLYYLENNHTPLISIFTTMPEEEITDYFGKERWKHDPIRDYALQDEEGIFLSTIKDYIEASPFQLDSFWQLRTMVGQLESFGCHDLYICPFNKPDSGGWLILTVTTKDRNIEAFHKLISVNSTRLRSLVKAIDIVGTKKFPDIFLRHTVPPKINQDILELLQVMVQEDLKLIDAAKRLNISRDIANRWIKSLKTELKVETTARAVGLTLEAGLIAMKNTYE